MKKAIMILLGGLVFLSILMKNIFASGELSAKIELRRIYEQYCSQSSDINEHIPVLKQLATQCESVVEIGVRSVVSTWGILQGLSEKSSGTRSYLGIDLDYPLVHTLNLAQRLAQANGISFRFWQINDMDIAIVDVSPVDMLFIDSLHTYCHLTYELEKFSAKVQKYIAMHDTSEPWGTIDDGSYHGDYSEYPAEYDRNKKGLWLAVEDFLKRHQEWSLHERRINNHGFTVLTRVSR